MKVKKQREQIEVADFDLWFPFIKLGPETILGRQRWKADQHPKNFLLMYGLHKQIKHQFLTRYLLMSALLSWTAAFLIILDVLKVEIRSFSPLKQTQMLLLSIFVSDWKYSVCYNIMISDAFINGAFLFSSSWGRLSWAGRRKTVCHIFDNFSFQ